MGRTEGSLMEGESLLSYEKVFSRKEGSWVEEERHGWKRKSSGGRRVARKSLWWNRRVMGEIGESLLEGEGLQ